MFRRPASAHLGQAGRSSRVPPVRASTIDSREHMAGYREKGTGGRQAVRIRARTSKKATYLCSCDRAFSSVALIARTRSAEAEGARPEASPPTSHRPTTTGHRRKTRSLDGHYWFGDHVCMFGRRMRNGHRLEGLNNLELRHTGGWIGLRRISEGT